MTLEDVYERIFCKSALSTATPRGRVVTEKAIAISAMICGRGCFCTQTDLSLVRTRECNDGSGDINQCLTEIFKQCRQ